MKNALSPKEFRIYDSKNNVMVVFDFMCSPEGEFKDTDPINQWIGEYDEKKNKIYEGDIIDIKVKTEFGSLTTIRGTIFFCEKHLAFEIEEKSGFDWQAMKGDEGLVVGNIYQGIKKNIALV